MQLFHFIILIPFIFAIIVPFLYRYINSKIHPGWMVAVVPSFIFISLLLQIPEIAGGETFFSSVPWIPSLNLHFSIYIDGLAILFGLLISGIGFLVIIYSIFYMSKREALHNFYVYLLMFMGAMLGVVFIDNIFMLYTFWELTSVSSFLLIAFWYERKRSRQGALKAMLITVSGGLAMLAGFIMLALVANTFSIRELIDSTDVLQTSSLFIPAMILIIMGAFTKSAQFPFSIWLPDAMEAPTPVSAYLHSATMVKAGLYLVARVTPIFAGHGVWFWVISGFGLLTLIYGSVRAVRQTDLKAMLAYSTISQLGLIMSLLGIGSLAYYFDGLKEQEIFAGATLAAIFHLFNHSTFKGSLFMMVGIIDHETGTRDIRRLGGLVSVMPITFTIAMIGSLSMAGLPPFNGFLSKEMFFTGVLNASHINNFGMDSFGMIFPIVAWVASVFTFIYCMVLLFKPFTGKLHPERLPKANVHEAPIGMLISPIILVSLVVIVFFFPNILVDYILKPALVSVLPLASIHNMDIHIEAWHGFNTELWMTIGVIIFGLILFLSIKKWNLAFRFYPEKWSLNYLYNSFMEKVEANAVGFTNRYMTGSIRHYLIYILGFFVLIIGGSLIIFGIPSFDFTNNGIISVYDIGIIVAMAIAAFTVLLTNNRITAIVALGGVGYLVVMLFVMLRAPDLALTQMVVETVTTVLFLLCFYHLPKLGKQIEKIKFKVTNVIISIAVGITVTVMTLAANGHKLFESISGYFENAYELAGAKNIVNSIIVDFRGFDTMLEISVFLIAGLGVYTLIRLHVKGSESDEAK